MFAQAATTELTKAIKPAILGKEEGGEGVKRNWVKSGKARKLIYFCVIIDHWCQAFACGVGGGGRLGAAKLSSYKILRFP